MRALQKTPLLAARNLCVGYPGRPVLSSVDIDIYAGEVCAFIGPNGAGKTTLFRALAGELVPDSGQVLVDTQAASLPAPGQAAGRTAVRVSPPSAESGLCSLYALSRRQKARLVARVLQGESPAWPLSVRSYVEAGLFALTGWLGSPEPGHRAQVDAALTAMDLADFAQRPVTELSGGEFRRVLIARALVQDTPILLLDEPSSDLDVARQMATLGLMRQLARSGRAIAFSVHDLNLAAIVADKVALISGGRIVAAGRPKEVITTDIIKKYYGAELVVAGHPLADLPQIAHAPEWLARRHSDTPY